MLPGRVLSQENNVQRNEDDDTHPECCPWDRGEGCEAGAGSEGTGSAAAHEGRPTDEHARSVAIRRSLDVLFWKLFNKQSR